MGVNTDKLESLFKDSSAIQEEEIEKLVTLLKPYVVLGKDKGNRTMNFKPPFLGLVNIEKLEIIFLAEKARALYLEEGKNEGLKQSDVLALKVMPVGSAKSSLKKLFDDRWIIRETGSKYILPNHRLPELFVKYSVNKKEDHE